MRLNISYEHDIPINAFRWTPRSISEPLHYHASLEIGLCVSGTGIFHFGEKRYHVQVGDIFIVNNLELHIAQSDEHNPSTFIFLNFDPGLLLAEQEDLLLPFAYRSDRFDNLIPADWETRKHWVRTYLNPYREWIGAPIRADGFAYGAAGAHL